jgi:outer membrane protein assembly factor BamB
MRIRIRRSAGPGPLLVGALALLAALGGRIADCADDERGAANSSPASFVDWPLFGRVPERTRYLPAQRRALDPPLQEAWSIDTHGLIEFPPAVAAGVAYVVNKFGNLEAVPAQRPRGPLAADARSPQNAGKPTDVTAPVYCEGRVYVAFLDGELVAFDAKTGKPYWKRNLYSHLEFSPMAAQGQLYIGTDKTDVIALSASDGKMLWRFNSPAAIKASPSYHDGRVYVADYKSGMLCLDASSGELLWRTNTSKAKPFGRGGFYSSPAVAFGRVFAARDDGTAYAFDQGTGKVEWFFPTDDYTYGSPRSPRRPVRRRRSTSAPTTSASTR